MERIDSCHSIWLFDTERMRFRRRPERDQLDSRRWRATGSRTTAWRFRPETGAFAVALNECRTRLLRSWRHTDPASTASR